MEFFHGERIMKILQANPVCNAEVLAENLAFMTEPNNIDAFARVDRSARPFALKC
jgi:hypothetical protein